MTDDELRSLVEKATGPIARSFAELHNKERAADKLRALAPTIATAYLRLSEHNKTLLVTALSHKRRTRNEKA